MTGFLFELVIPQTVRESDAFPVKLVDRTMMGQPVQQCRGQSRIAESAGPLGSVLI